MTTPRDIVVRRAAPYVYTPVEVPATTESKLEVTSVATTLLTKIPYALDSATSSPEIPSTFLRSTTTTTESTIPTTSQLSSTSSTSIAGVTPGPTPAAATSPSLSLGAGVGIGLGAAIALLLVLNISFFLYRRGRNTPRAEKKEPEPGERKAELEDQAKHELSGTSLAPWLNRWRNGVRRTWNGDEPQELPEEARVELQQDVLPQELRTGPRSSTCGSNTDSESSSAYWLCFPEGLNFGLEESMLIFNDAGPCVQSSKQSVEQRGRARTSGDS